MGIRRERGFSADSEKDVYSSSRNTRAFRHGIDAQKGTLFHRGYNPAMKNKRSDTPKRADGRQCFSLSDEG